MADSQDIFMLLLIILFMSNNNADTQSVNSLLLALLLFGSAQNRNTDACGCDNAARIASINSCRCCNI